jgi:hypothetical protein
VIIARKVSIKVRPEKPVAEGVVQACGAVKEGWPMNLNAHSARRDDIQQLLVLLTLERAWNVSQEKRVTKKVLHRKKHA